MKKRFTKYLFALSLLPAFLTGCYTQLATQDDSSTIPADQTYEDLDYYQEEEVSSGGYFDESDTVNYYNEGEESVDTTSEVVINNYYGYVPYDDDDDYYAPYYPSVSFSFGYGYTPYYYPWHIGWYYPYYCYPAYLYPSYCYYPSFYSYYPVYYPHYSYGGYYANYYSPKYKTRNGNVSRIRNTGGRGYGDTRRNALRNPQLTKTNRTISTTGRDVRGLGTNNRNGKDRDLLSLGSEKRDETKRIRSKDNSTFTRDRIKTKNNDVQRTLGVKNTDRTKRNTLGTKNTDVRIKQTKGTRTKNLTTKKNTGIRQKRNTIQLSDIKHLKRPVPGRLIKHQNGILQQKVIIHQNVHAVILHQEEIQLVRVLHREQLLGVPVTEVAVKEDKVGWRL
jgi:hypothetical protein